MATCCVGYYSELSNNPQVIQGEYWEILRDPLYITDIELNLIPLKHPEVFKKDTHNESQDLLGGNGLMIYGQGLKLAGQGSSDPSNTIYGKGLGPYAKRKSHLYSIDDDSSAFGSGQQMGSQIGDQQLDDLGVLNKNRPKISGMTLSEDARRYHLDRIRKEKMKRDKIKRPSLEQKFKMTNNIEKRPGEGLINRLIKREKQFTKRTKIKDLLDRLR